MVFSCIPWIVSPFAYDMKPDASVVTKRMALCVVLLHVRSWGLAGGFSWALHGKTNDKSPRDPAEQAALGSALCTTLSFAILFYFWASHLFLWFKAFGYCMNNGGEGRSFTDVNDYPPVLFAIVGTGVRASIVLDVIVYLTSVQTSGSTATDEAKTWSIVCIVMKFYLSAIMNRIIQSKIETSGTFF